jgi:hypothetical protein
VAEFSAQAVEHGYHPASGIDGLPTAKHSYGLPEEYDKLVVADIIVLLIDALKGIGATDNKLLQAHTKADHHNPSSPDAA